MKYALLLCFCFSAHCSLKDLVKEYLQENMNIKSNELDSQSASYNLGITQAQNDWMLSAALSHEEEEGVGFFSFNQVNTRTEYATVGISKDNFWGGEFSLKQEIYKYDLREWSSTPAVGVSPYETVTTISYAQDLGANFFGLEYRTDEQITETTAKVTQVNLSIQNQNLLYDFLTNYLNAKLDKTLVDLNEESLKRAQKRRAVIAKRVRDRLSKTVDLYQSQIAEYSQEETLLSQKRSLSQNLNQLSSDLHRKIMETELTSYDLINPPLSEKTQGKLERSLDLQSLQEKLVLAKLSLKKAKRGYYPSITLTGSYSTDSLQANFNEAYSRGAFGSGAEVGSISLAVSFPLGMRQVRSEVAQEQLDLQKNEYLLKKTKTNLTNSLFNLESRISLLKTQIDISKKKRLLAQKALQEQNRLYYLGKKDLEEVIRSEETLIDTEIKLANNLTLYNLLLGQYASVKGKLLSFVYQLIE